MAQVDWYIEGVEFSNCNCDYACPCQFESRRPTYGDCRGFAAVRIDKDHFGDVVLDGLGAALLYAWPGPIARATVNAMPCYHTANRNSAIGALFSGLPFASTTARIARLAFCR